jgi:hypothetical protein
VQRYDGRAAVPPGRSPPAPPRVLPQAHGPGAAPALLASVLASEERLYDRPSDPRPAPGLSSKPVRGSPQKLSAEELMTIGRQGVHGSGAGGAEQDYTRRLAQLAKMPYGEVREEEERVRRSGLLWDHQAQAEHDRRRAEALRHQQEREEEERWRRGLEERRAAEAQAHAASARRRQSAEAELREQSGAGGGHETYRKYLSETELAELDDLQQEELARRRRHERRQARRQVRGLPVAPLFSTRAPPPFPSRPSCLPSSLPRSLSLAPS